MIKLISSEIFIYSRKVGTANRSNCVLSYYTIYLFVTIAQQLHNLTFYIIILYYELQKCMINIVFTY